MPLRHTFVSAGTWVELVTLTEQLARGWVDESRAGQELRDLHEQVMRLSLDPADGDSIKGSSSYSTLSKKAQLDLAELFWEVSELFGKEGRSESGESYSIRAHQILKPVIKLGQTEKEVPGFACRLPGKSGEEQTAKWRSSRSGFCISAGKSHTGAAWRQISG